MRGPIGVPVTLLQLFTSDTDYIFFVIIFRQESARSMVQEGSSMDMWGGP